MTWINHPAVRHLPSCPEGLVAPPDPSPYRWAARHLGICLFVFPDEQNALQIQAVFSNLHLLLSAAPGFFGTSDDWAARFSLGSPGELGNS